VLARDVARIAVEDGVDHREAPRDGRPAHQDRVGPSPRDPASVRDRGPLANDDDGGGRPITP
jgi:hypothetical protein